MTTSGYPAPALTETGSLPSGVTFLDNGDGTATLSGTPTSGGSFPITITAAKVATALSFTVKTSGYPAPAITESGALPGGVTFTNNGNGTATITGTPTASGTFALALTAKNSLGTATQTLTIRVRA